MQQKRRWRRVDGVLLLDKPRGMTSNDALQKARRLFSAEKGGHTGTLDPMADGLLPLCFGEATKFSNDLLDADKTYEADILLGSRTDTGDAEGQVIETRPVAVDAGQVIAALDAFRGEISQVPPMYSALKRDGRPLYELARQGIEVEREARRVTIHELTLLAMTLPTLRVRVCCSKGTYIRTLAEDLGAALGCGAHLTALRRVAVGDLDVAQALTLDGLAELPEEAREGLLAPVDALLKTLPRVDLDGLSAERFRLGNAVSATLPAGDRLRVYIDNALAGVGIPDAQGRLQPKRLLRLADLPANAGGD